MADLAADIVELPPVAQVKLVLMAGIKARIRFLYGELGAGAGLRAAERLNVDESEVSRLCGGRHSRFSLEKLVEYATEIGVKITIRAE